MAATQYQILYRYINPNSNQFLKNDMESPYKPVFELYHDKHKIAIGSSTEILEANNEKSELIINGNNTSIDNYGMLFKFTGTKRKNKKVWVPVSTGYVIRDISGIQDKISRAVDGDYSKPYLLIEGTTIENGVVISKTNPVTKEIVISDATYAKNGVFYQNEEELYNVLKEMTIAKIATTTLAPHGTLNTYIPWSSSGVAPGGVYNIGIKVGYNFTLSDITYQTTSSSSSFTIAKNALTDAAYNTVKGSGGQAFTKVSISSAQVETYQIPAHYEEVSDYPYVVCDTYEKIEQSPWFILSSHASLVAAIEKAKMIVKSVGLENVKMIKVVPTEQSIKIR